MGPWAQLVKGDSKCGGTDQHNFYACCSQNNIRSQLADEEKTSKKPLFIQCLPPQRLLQPLRWSLRSRGGWILFDAKQVPAASDFWITKTLFLIIGYLCQSVCVSTMVIICIVSVLISAKNQITSHLSGFFTMPVRLHNDFVFCCVSFLCFNVIWCLSRGRHLKKGWQQSIFICK